MFMKYAHLYDVEQLLKLVDIQVRTWYSSYEKQQTLEITQRGFNRKFYFHPGLWHCPNNHANTDL